MASITPYDRVRLAAGYHFFRDDQSGTWLLYGSDDVFTSVEVSDELARAVLPVLHGLSTPGQALAAVGDIRAFSELVEAFLENGFVVPLTGRTSPAFGPGAVVEVRGENPLAHMVASLLEVTGVAPVRRVTEDAPLEPASLIVSCDGWLPDARWLAVDAWCAERGVPWLMSYAETTRYFLGPLYRPGSTPGYRDVRTRRLAAAPNPDELLAYWRHLDRGEDVRPSDWPDAGILAILAGVLAQESLKLLRDDPAPSISVQFEFEPQQMQWQSHPVLPVPANLMLEVPA